MKITERDIYHAVGNMIAERAAELNVTGIVAEIIATYGMRMPADIPAAELRDIVSRHEWGSEDGEDEPVMSRTAAIRTLNRMGNPYGEDDVMEVMRGDAWVPHTDAEWRHWHSVA